MTLIAAFKCSDGYVVSADSQETVDHYRVSRQKINPTKRGNFQLAVGGSGNGDLIDAFVHRLEVNVENSSIKTLPELEKFIHVELLDFAKNEAVLRPEKEREMKFIIGAASIDPPSVIVWRTAETQLIPVDSYDLAGWDEPLYHHIAKRLYRPGIPVIQGIFLGLHLLELAGRTSNYVGGDTTVVVACENGLWLENQDKVRELTKRVQRFVSQLDNLILACPDTSISSDTFSETLRKFEETVLRLRQDYLQAAAEWLVSQGIEKYQSSYPEFPLGSLIRYDETSPEERNNIRVREPKKKEEA